MVFIPFSKQSRCSILILIQLIFCGAQLASAHATSEIKTHFLYTGHISDFGFNYNVERTRVSSIERFRDIFETSIRSSFSERVNPSNLQSILNELVSQNVSHVISPSTPLAKSVVDLAPFYPNFQFIVWTVSPRFANSLSKNLLIVRINQYTASWLAGYTCALLSPNKVGLVVPYVDPLLSIHMLNSYYAGAQAASPEVQIGWAKVLDYDVPLAAYASAKSLDAWGAQCISSNQNNALASKYYSSVGKSNIGIGTDERIYAGEFVGTSMIYDLTNPMNNLFERIMNVSFKNSNVQSSFATKEAVLDPISVQVAPWGLKFPRRLRSQIINMSTEINSNLRQIFCGHDLNVLNILKHGQKLIELGTNEVHFFNSTAGPIPHNWCLPTDAIYDPKVMKLSRYIELVSFWTEDTAKTPDYWSFSHAMSIAALVLAALLFAICTYLLLHLIYYWNTKVYTVSSNKFILMVIVSTMVSLLSVPVWIGKPTKFSCNFRIWTESIGFVLIIASVLARNFKIWRWARNGFTTLSIENVESFTLSSYELFFQFLTPATLVTLIILVLWSSNSPVVPYFPSASFLPFGVVESGCRATITQAFRYSFSGYLGLLLILLIVITYKCRNIALLGGQAVRDGIAILNSGLLAGIATVVISVTKRESITVAITIWMKILTFYIEILVIVVFKWYYITVAGHVEPLEEEDKCNPSKKIEDSSLDTHSLKAHDIPPEYYSDSSNSSSESDESAESSDIEQGQKKVVEETIQSNDSKPS